MYLPQPALAAIRTCMTFKTEKRVELLGIIYNLTPAKPKLTHICYKVSG